MPERLTHQALPALACFVGLLGPSCGPPWGSACPGSSPWLWKLPLGSSNLCSGHGLCLGTAQMWRRWWLEQLGAVPKSWLVPHALPLLGGGPGDLPVKQYLSGVWLAPTLGFSNKREKQGAVNGKRPGHCVWRQMWIWCKHMRGSEQ